MTKNFVYFIPCMCDEVYKGETSRSLDVRLEEHRKVMFWGEIEGQVWMTIYGKKKKGNHTLSWDEVKIIGKNIEE